MYTNWIEINFKFYHYVFGIYDIVGILLASSLFGMWLQQFLKDRKTLDEIDPKKTSNLID